MAEKARYLVLDTDALVLLASADLLDNVLGVLELGKADFRYNATFPYYFPKKIRQKLPEILAVRVDAAILAGKPLEEMPSEARVASLQAINGIDAGEAVLFSVVAEQNALLFSTNDKRALSCLATDDRASETRRALAGRILSIEHILSALLADKDSGRIMSKCREASTLDKMLQVVFSDFNMKNPDQCRSALDSYRSALESDCGEELFMRDIGRGVR